MPQVIPNPFSGLLKSLNSKVDKAPTSETASDALQSENAALRESLARLSKLALQASHDIRSPLAALRVMISSQEFPEEMRETLNQIASRVNVIADTLLKTDSLPDHDDEKSQIAQSDGTRNTRICLALPVIESILSKQRIAAGAQGIRIEFNVSPLATFGLVAMPSEKLEKILSKAMDSAMANLPPELENFCIRLRCEEAPGDFSNLDDLFVEIISEDGLPLSKNLRLPRAKPPAWLALPEHFFLSPSPGTSTKKITVVDDEPSMISIWKDIFGAQVEIDYFASPDYFWQSHKFHGSPAGFGEEGTPASPANFYLIDYEFRNTSDTPSDESINGLDLIERILDLDRQHALQSGSSVKAHQTFLVTSHHDQSEIHDRVIKLGVKLLPKALAPFLAPLVQGRQTPPDQHDGEIPPVGAPLAAQRVDFILVDDDPLVRDVWRMAANRSLHLGLYFATAAEAKRILAANDFIHANGITQNTPIFVDFSLAESDLSARELLESLHHIGYQELYVATGHDPSHPAVVALFDLDYLSGILGKGYPQNHITVIKGASLRTHFSTETTLLKPTSEINGSTESKDFTTSQMNQTNQVNSSFITTLLAFLILLSLPLSGCGIPGADKIGAAPNPNATVYHQSRVECDGIDLSSSEFSPSALRTLMHCLNANREIPKLDAFVASSRDEELTPLSQSFSRDLLMQFPRLFEVNHTLETLRSDGQLTALLDIFGRFLQYPALITSAMQLLEDGYFASEGGMTNYVRSFIAPTPNPHALIALEVLGQELTIPRLEMLLNIAQATTSSRVFQNIQSHFQSTQTGTPELSVIFFALKELLNWEISQSQSPVGQPATMTGLIQPLVSSLADGSFWQVADTLLPETSPQWQQNLLKLHDSMKSLYIPRGDFFAHIPSFMQELNAVERGGPLACMRNSTSLVGLSAAQVFSELDHLSLREFLGSLMVARPFCEFPDGFLRETATFMDLANSDGAAGLELVVRSTNRSITMQTTLIHALSERYHSRALAEDSSVLRLLEPLVNALENQGAWRDLLLLSSAVRVQDRQDLSNLARALLRPQPELQGKSTLLVLLEILSKTTVDHWVSFANAAKPLLDETTPLARPLAQMMRHSFKRTDAHPFFDLIRSTLIAARGHESYFTALFKIMARNTEAFTGMLREVSGLARQNDGRLQELLFSLMNTFTSGISRGRHNVNIQTVAAFDLNLHLHHDIIDSELAQIGALPRRMRREEALRACRQYDFQFSFMDFARNDFSSQIENMAQCLALYDDTPHVLPALEFLTRTPLSSISSPSAAGNNAFGTNQTLLNYSVELVRSFVGSGVNAISGLVSRVLPEIRNGTLARASSAFHFFLGSDRSQSAIDPLLALVARSQSRSTTAPGETSVAITNPVHLCHFAGEYLDEVPTVGVDCSHTYPVREAISLALATWEPETSGNAELKRRRIQEIMDDYLYSNEHDFHSMATKEEQHSMLMRTRNETITRTRVFSALKSLETRQLPANDPQGQDRFKGAFALVDFLKSLNPNFSPFGAAFRPEAFTQDETYRRGSLDTADRLARFLIEQANTLTVMPYYYLGDIKPRVILVNNLDRLSLILEVTDFKVETALPLGIIGLFMIPNTWEEAPENQRPAYLTQFANPEDEVVPHNAHRLIENFLGGISSPLGTCEISQAQLTEALRDGGPGASSIPAEKRSCFSKVSNLRGFTALNDEHAMQPSLISLFLDYAPVGVDCAASAHACLGMKMIRNLYSLIYEYTPAEMRMPFPARPYISTNLLTPMDLFKTGLMRIVGRWLRGLDENDVRVREVLRSSAILAHNPQAMQSIHDLLTIALQHTDLEPTQWQPQSPPAPRGLLRTLFEVFWNLPEDQKTNFIQMTSSLLQAGPSTGLMEEPTNIVDAMLKTSKGLLHPSGGRSLLTQNAPAVISALSTPFYRNLFAEFTQDALSTTGTAANPAPTAGTTSLWHTFRSRYINGRNHASYPRADMDRLTRDVVAFLEHPEATDENHRRELFASLVNTLIQEIISGRAQGLLTFMANHPAEVDSLLRAADLLYTQGSTDRLMDMLGRWMRMNSNTP